ncbi:MAG TPA: acyltransferase [Anaerolineales bacterium]|nr:acyltransferase [Anaerolineales bacterium]
MSRERTAPAHSLPYMPGLDGLRAVAVLAVFLYHVGFPWAAGGFLGVETFFMLSGYLITSLLLRDHREHGRLRMGCGGADRRRGPWAGLGHVEHGADQPPGGPLSPGTGAGRRGPNKHAPGGTGDTRGGGNAVAFPHPAPFPFLRTPGDAPDPHGGCHPHGHRHAHAVPTGGTIDPVGRFHHAEHPARVAGDPAHGVLFHGRQARPPAGPPVDPGA